VGNCKPRYSPVRKPSWLTSAAPQTLEFAHALKTLGTPSATVIYPNEGHAIRDPEHLADLDARTVSWFDRYLK
jgi:dipeptidyl aminopeptidase/acylaminoacyl peptidase